MRRLVIDTATHACSVALFEDEACIAAFHEDIGRGHAERLVPMIAGLPNKGRSDIIHVNVGPGSFTGIRVGVSAARALAFAWGAECHGYASLDLIAAMARDGEDIAVDVAVTGGHGEYYFQSFDADGAALAPPQSLPPEAAASVSTAAVVAGDMAERMVALRGSGQAIDLLPNAQSWPRLAGREPLLPSPLYVRGPDAKLPGGVKP
jgi:tRNA threonylcarbamoyladenosine biosynthesis protein TsaB